MVVNVRTDHIRSGHLLPASLKPQLYKTGKAMACRLTVCADDIIGGRFFSRLFCRHINSTGMQPFV